MSAKSVLHLSLGDVAGYVMVIIGKQVAIADVGHGVAGVEFGARFSKTEIFSFIGVPLDFPYCPCYNGLVNVALALSQRCRAGRGPFLWCTSCGTSVPANFL